MSSPLMLADLDEFAARLRATIAAAAEGDALRAAVADGASSRTLHSSTSECASNRTSLPARPADGNTARLVRG